jgi:hypothetical protein
MNKFFVASCIDLEKDKGSEYQGPVVILSNISDEDFVLFFPIGPEYATIINKILESYRKDEEDDEEDDDNDANDEILDSSILGIYKTMIESWNAGDKFLSGITIDTIFEEEIKKEIPLIRLVLSDENGMVDTYVRVNFIHAILLAVMEKLHIIISDKVLDIMLPDSEDATDRIKKKDDQEFPEDKNIISIAHKIMKGKIKDINKKKK